MLKNFLLILLLIFQPYSLFLCLFFSLSFPLSTLLILLYLTHSLQLTTNTLGRYNWLIILNILLKMLNP